MHKNTTVVKRIFLWDYWLITTGLKDTYKNRADSLDKKVYELFKYFDNVLLPCDFIFVFCNFWPMLSFTKHIVMLLYF